MSAENRDGGGRLTMKIVVGGGRLGKIGKWEAGGRVKLLVGGGKQGNNSKKLCLGIVRGF